MGRVRITEKPGVWPYVLVNDFKQPPYFAYEVVDYAGNKQFVRVLKGAPLEPGYEPVALTKKRKIKIMQFLRDTLKNPLKYGEFMSMEWIEQLLEFLDILDARSIEATSKIVVELWLKDRVFRKLIQENHRNLKDPGKNSAAVQATEEGTEELPSTSGSQAQEDQQKRQSPEKDDSSEVEKNKKTDQNEIEVVTL